VRFHALVAGRGRAQPLCHSFTPRHAPMIWNKGRLQCRHVTNLFLCHDGSEAIQPARCHGLCAGCRWLPQSSSQSSISWKGLLPAAIDTSLLHLTLELRSLCAGNVYSCSQYGAVVFQNVAGCHNTRSRSISPAMQPRSGAAQGARITILPARSLRHPL
jgi:hypothetical protein